MPAKFRIFVRKTTQMYLYCTAMYPYNQPYRKRYHTSEFRGALQAADSAYSLLVNGKYPDKLLEAGGRYSDTTAFDFMNPMGIWFKNIAQS
jgi:hypothetical protein